MNNQKRPPWLRIVGVIAIAGILYVIWLIANIWWLPVVALSIALITNLIWALFEKN